MRSRIEWVARAIALIALGAAWWMWQFPQSEGRLGDVATGGHDAADSVSLASVAKMLRTSGNNTLRISLSAVPGRHTRALLHAARDAGWRVEWSAIAASAATTASTASTSSSLSATSDTTLTSAATNARFVSANAIAISASPRPDPAGGTVVQVAAPDNSDLTLSDSLGWIDSVRVSDGGTYWDVPGDARAFRIESAQVTAAVDAAPSRIVKRIRVFGAPGWESRFLLDALEAAGWQVDANLSIAPRVSVTAGSPGSLDTARYAAVIALDSSAWSQGAAISRYVRSGGGLILFPGSARSSAFASVRVGSAGSTLAGVPGALRSASPAEGLALTPVTGLSRNAVVLARSTRAGSPVAVAARRVGAGRVLQVGFEQTWEWRMLGGDDAVLAHRDWWRSMLQRVAYSTTAPIDERWMPLPGDAAPLADLVARVGGPADGYSTDPGPFTRSAPPVWLFALAAAALLVEWWSRRLRGAV